MPTIRQRKLAQVIVENSTLDKPLNGGEMLAKVSYSKGLQKQVKRVIETEGVKQALEDLGFTEDNAKKVVSEIMLNEEIDPSARLKATDQVFKVQGSYAPEKNVNLNMTVKTEVEQKANDIIRRFLTNDTRNS